MKLYIGGTCNVDSLASHIDALNPSYEIVTGKPNLFHDELALISSRNIQTDCLFLIIDYREDIPSLYEYTASDDSNQVRQSIAAWVLHIRSLILDFRNHCATPVFISTPLFPHRFPTGFQTLLLEDNPIGLFEDLRNEIIGVCKSVSDAYLLDIENIAASIGKTHVYDAQSRYFSQQPFSDSMLKALAQHIHACAIRMNKPPLKCVVLDLDNTLWGGVVGEDGYDSLILGNSGLGKAYIDFQKELLKFFKQGVYLAICSKNNTCDALAVLEKHPSMIIRPSMIAAMRVNWDDKPKNVIEISHELHISTDAMLFIDDSKTEQALMKSIIPNIHILELPENPTDYASTLTSHFDLFWPRQITSDDLSKKVKVAQNYQRRHAASVAPSIEAFLKDSNIRMTIEPLSQALHDRASQLLAKTNQFNTSLQRYSASELVRFGADPHYQVYCMSLVDNYGDYGMCGVAVLGGNSIDTFALSCRILGKKAEFACMDFLIQSLRIKGNDTISLIFTHGDRNQQVRMFLEEFGFTLSNSTSAHESLFILPKTVSSVNPSWITVEYINEGSQGN